MGKRITAEPLLVPRATDYGLFDSADHGTGRATIADQVAVGLAAQPGGILVDDFDSFQTLGNGGGWLAIASAPGGSLLVLPSGLSGTPSFPSDGCALFDVTATPGAKYQIAKPGSGAAIDSGTPVVFEFKFCKPRNNAGAITDDNAIDFFAGLLGIEASVLNAVVFYGSVVAGARQYRLATDVAGVLTYENVTLPAGNWGVIRLTVTAAGTKVEASMEGGAYSTILNGAVAPTHMVYSPWLGASGYSVAERYVMFDWVRLRGLLAADTGAGGALIPVAVQGAFPGFGNTSTTACVGNDSRLADSRTPTGGAGGDLAGTFPNPTIAALAVTDAKVAAANKDGSAGTASMRTLGTGAAQACAGNDSRLSDSRAPNGAAGGDLAGTYPNPTIAALAVTDAKVAAANKDGASGTASMRTLGTSAAQACAGNDSRLSDSRVAASVSTAVLQTTTSALSGDLDFNAREQKNLKDPTTAQSSATWNTTKTVEVLTKTAAYSLLATDPRVIQVDDTAGRVDLTLPAPSSKRRYTIQKIAGTTGGIRLIRNGAEKIMTVAASYDLPTATTAFASGTPQAWLVYSDGTDWWVC